MFNNDWDEQLKEEVEKPYFNDLRYALAREYKLHTVYPSKENLFQALKLTPYEDTKVVILGQDPYHGPGQAHGLSFSVMPGVRIPPSLVNIYKELHSDLGVPIPNNGYLVPWAKQGVLLLNTVLTVREGQANSHKDLGWERFTDAVIEKLNERDKPGRFHFVGQPCAEKGGFYRPEQTSGAEIRPPQPAFGTPRIFWQPPFFQNERIFGVARHGADRLVDSGSVTRRLSKRAAARFFYSITSSTFSERNSLYTRTMMILATIYAGMAKMMPRRPEMSPPISSSTIIVSGWMSSLFP